MTKDTFEFENNTDLDALFTQARVEQPLLVDANFTKVVVNGLPNISSRIERRGLSFDFFGMLLGLVAVYFFIEPTQLLSTILNFVPESLTLSITTLAIGVLGGLGLSFGAWVAVEKIA